jgi:hypothetical protein
MPWCLCSENEPDSRASLGGLIGACLLLVALIGAVNAGKAARA